MENEPLAKVVDPQRLDFEKENLMIVENVRYADRSERQKMDVFYPKGQAGPMPAVVWIHGGGWSSEELDLRYRPEAELGKLAKMGFVIASIEYRLCQHAPFPAQIADCKCAIRYLRAHAQEFNINPGRIGVWGESAGGHLASLLGAAGDVMEFEGDDGNLDYSSKVQAVCSWYTPYDMLKSALESQDTQDNVFRRLFEGGAEEKRDLIWSASPMKYAGEKLPPFLIMHGTTDRLVPYAQSKDFYDAMVAAGNDAEMISVPGQGHGFFDGQEYYDMIFDFFRKHLQN